MEHCLIQHGLLTSADEHTQIIKIVVAFIIELFEVSFIHWYYDYEYDSDN